MSNGYECLDFDTRESWLAWRRGGLGSSDATILAASAGRVSSPSWLDAGAEQALFWDKLGMGKPQADNPAMRRGREMEEPVRQMAEERLGLMTPVNLQRKDEPWLRASLDGLTLDNEIVEIKVPGAAVVEAARAGRIIDYYEAQIAHQLMALHGHPSAWSGEERFHYVVYDVKTEELLILSRSSRELQALAADLFELEQRFWRRLQTHDAPVGGHAWYGLATVLSEVKTDMALADAYKDQVREAVEREGYVPSGFYVRQVAQRTSRRVDWAGLFASLEVEEESLQPFRGESQWVVMGGARPQTAPTTQPWMAEEAIAQHKRDKDELDVLVSRAREMGKVHGLLIGPYGMRVFNRPGTVNYTEAAKALGVGDATIEAHTFEVVTPGYTMLVAKGAKKKAAQPVAA